MVNSNFIQCGDCLKLLKTIPNNSIDLVITDPPYKIDTTGAGLFNKNDNKYKNKNAYSYMNNINSMSDGFSELVLDELCRVMKKINIYMVFTKTSATTNKIFCRKSSV